MNASFNRRNWLKASFAITAGFGYHTALANKLMASPVSEAELRVRQTNSSTVKLRLASNENPYGPSEKARQAMMENLSETNRYPFDMLPQLKELLAAKEGVTADYIAIGAGSSDLLCAAGAAFGIEGGRILSGFPTFPMLMNYASVFGAVWDKVKVNDKLEEDYEAMASQIKDDTRLVFVCNPNNPTGTFVDAGKVSAFCEEVSKKVPVFCDEAYLEYLEADQQLSMVDLVKKGASVVVSRTFSKIYGLAGVRLGYVVARPDLIQKISRYQILIPHSQTGIAAAKASIGDVSFMESCRRKNAQARKILTGYLDRKGYVYGRSHTNFVFFDPQADAQRIMTSLADKGIAIRVWDYDGKQWCRVSVGMLEEMKVFVNTFEKIV